MPAGSVMMGVIVIVIMPVVVIMGMRMIVRVIMLVSRVCVGVREFVIMRMMVMARSRHGEPLQSLIKEGCADHYDGQAGERPQNRVNLIRDDILRKE